MANLSDTQYKFLGQKLANSQTISHDSQLFWKTFYEAQI